MEMHKAVKLLNYNSLSVISTDRQIKNGTIMVMDDVLEDMYTIHENGYVRSIVPVYQHYFGWKIKSTCYQLNPVKINKNEITGGNCKERILFPGEYYKLAEIVVRVAHKRKLKSLANK